MTTILAAIAAGASLLGILYALFAPQTVPRQVRSQAWRTGELRTLNWFAAAASVVLFLFTLPTMRPFSPGLALGFGFLVGVAIARWSLEESVGEAAGNDWIPRTVMQLCLVSLGPSALLLIFHGYPNAALVGCALGALFVAAVASVVLRPASVIADEDRQRVLGSYRGVEVYALGTAAVVAGVLLGIAHFARPTPGDAAGGYWALPVLLPAVAALALILVSEWIARSSPQWSPLAAGAVAGAIAVVVAALLRTRLLPALAPDALWYGLLAVGFILVGLYQSRSGSLGDNAGTAEARAEPRPVALAFGAVLLALAVIAGAFKRQHGYGEALAVIAALPIVTAAYLSRSRRREPLDESLALGALTIMLLLVWYRLLVEKAGGGQELDFQRHYDVIGVALGLGACFGLLAFAVRGIGHARSGVGMPFLLARTGVLGFLVAAAPLVVAAAWGANTVGALLIGLVVAEAAWMMLVAWVTGADRDHALAAAPHVLFVAAALIATTFSPLVLAVALPRLAKLVLVAAATLIAIVWVFADAWRSARAAEGGVEP